MTWHMEREVLEQIYTYLLAGPLKHWPMPPEAKSTAESTKMSNVM